MQIHLVAGAAGCDENLDTFGPPMGPWSAFRRSAYGYGHLSIANASHALWQQLDAGDSSIQDAIWVIRDDPYGSAFPAY
jgi:hypothetical protein